jgi:alkanesulfonate monooxygenase SsuD/methylene tetrahydromethanopterin reductase-like flavin-dependent oxidoreductase (luciferase family)
VGTPQQIADELRPVIELGFRHLILDAMAPYDAETIERLPQVRELLSA